MNLTRCVCIMRGSFVGRQLLKLGPSKRESLAYGEFRKGLRELEVGVWVGGFVKVWGTVKCLSSQCSQGPRWTPKNDGVELELWRDASCDCKLPSSTASARGGTRKRAEHTCPTSLHTAFRAFQKSLDCKIHHSFMCFPENTAASSMMTYHQS